MPDLIVHPLGIAVLREYLLSVIEVTTVVGDRIGYSMPPAPRTEFDPPQFPALRLTEITSTEIVARRIVRMLVQIDCWASRNNEADRLGRIVLAALRESANFITGNTGAVLLESSDLSLRSEPDQSVSPSTSEELPYQPRSIVSAQIYVRPNP